MKLWDRITRRIWAEMPVPYVRVGIGTETYNIPRFSRHDFYKSNIITEKWFLTILKKINKEKKIETFLDVGVNIGQTLLKLKYLNKQIRYIGFEPNKKCIQLVESIKTKNRLADVSIIPVALSNKNQILKLFVNNEMDPSGSIVEGFRDHSLSDFQWVPTFRFDDIVNKIEVKKVDIIKIDVEGAELEVLKGMEKSIDKYKPFIIMEVLPSYSETNIQRVEVQKQIFSTIDKLHYFLYQIKNKESEIAFYHCGEGFPVHSNVNESDYFLAPKSINVKSLFK